MGAWGRHHAGLRSETECKPAPCTEFYDELCSCQSAQRACLGMHGGHPLTSLTAHSSGQPALSSRALPCSRPTWSGSNLRQRTSLSTQQRPAAGRRGQTSWLQGASSARCAAAEEGPLQHSPLDALLHRPDVIAALRGGRGWPRLGPLQLLPPPLRLPVRLCPLHIRAVQNKVVLPPQRAGACGLQASGCHSVTSAQICMAAATSMPCSSLSR